MECMTLAEIFATTIFSVKVMHDCIFFFQKMSEMEFLKIILSLEYQSIAW